MTEMSDRVARAIDRLVLARNTLANGPSRDEVVQERIDAQHALYDAVAAEVRGPLEARIAELTNALDDMVRQFAYDTTANGAPAYWTGGLSALEGAFAVLGWDDPHPCPENKCERNGCHWPATTGTPTPDGYKRLCSKHYQEAYNGSYPQREG